MRHAQVTLIATALLFGSNAGSAPAQTSPAPQNKPPTAQNKPPAAQIRPVQETLFGRKITDNYRYMEALDPATLAWMKAQAAFVRPDGAVHLDAEAAVDLGFTFVVEPGDTEHQDALGFGDAFEKVEKLRE